MILIVDDDVGFAETCAMLLETHGFDAGVASNGTDALSKLNATPYALLISDCSMPGMTGMDLLKKVKADRATAHLPVLMMSASLRCETLKDAPCDGFLKKPFLAEQLLFEVRKLLCCVTDLVEEQAKV